MSGGERAEAAVEQAQKYACRALDTTLLDPLLDPFFDPFLPDPLLNADFEPLLHAFLQSALDREPFHAGDVLHFAFSFNLFNILPQSLLELLR